MDSDFSNSLILIVLLVIFLIKGLIKIKDDQRVLVLRFGKFDRVLGPGLKLITPFLEHSIIVNLTKHLPHWKSLSEYKLNEAVKDLVLNDTSRNSDWDKWK